MLEHLYICCFKPDPVQLLLHKKWGIRQLNGFVFVAGQHDHIPLSGLHWYGSACLHCVRARANTHHFCYCSRVGTCCIDHHSTLYRLDFHTVRHLHLAKRCHWKDKQYNHPFMKDKQYNHPIMKDKNVTYICMCYPFDVEPPELFALYWMNSVIKTWTVQKHLKLQTKLFHKFFILCITIHYHIFHSNFHNESYLQYEYCFYILNTCV